MKNEIDKDFYCSAGAYVESEGNCCFSNGSQIGMAFGKCRKNKCPYYHRKHPTCEQYKEEYDREYPDDGAVYTADIIDEGDKPTWRTTEYWREKNRKPGFLIDRNDVIIGFKKIVIICACTPFGKPDDNWRPE